MPAYADFAFYVESYLGSVISEADFPRLALRASEIIDELTFNRAAAVVTADEDADTIEKIKLATCAVAEVIQTIEAGPEVQSERVGDHSVTYNVRARTDQQKIRDAAKLYLGLTGLMYPGLDE